MSYSHYERLTAADEVFLDLEGPATHMHVGCVCLYDLAPLQTALNNARVRTQEISEARALYDKVLWDLEFPPAETAEDFQSLRAESFQRTLDERPRHAMRICVTRAGQRVEAAQLHCGAGEFRQRERVLHQPARLR